MDRKRSLSNFEPTNRPFDEDIKPILYYLASQADTSEWSLDNPWGLSQLIIPLIRQTPTKRVLGEWVYPEGQSIQEALGIESSTKREDSVDTVLQKSIAAPQILKASLSKRETILQFLRPLSGRKTVLDKLRSRRDKLKTDISFEKHQLLGKKYGKRR